MNSLILNLFIVKKRNAKILVIPLMKDGDLLLEFYLNI